MTFPKARARLFAYRPFKSRVMSPRRVIQFFALAFVALAAQACVSFPDAPKFLASPQIEENRLVSIDGARLGLTVWEAKEPQAIILALHGMNDYSNAFAMPATWWAENANVTTYAFDQRGFGRSPGFGRWQGTETLKTDLRAAVAALRATHPDLPLFVLGHSMGAGVVIAAAAEAPLDADGLILAAPGVWGGPALPLHYRATLNVAASVAPAKTLTGERAHRQATDNIEILRQMARDPLVIKETRLDAVFGVARVMGKAYRSADEAGGVILFLMGEKDEIIPLDAMEETASRLKGSVEVRRYENGWHLLFRDLQAETVWRDVAAWIGEHIPATGAAARLRIRASGD